MYTFFFLDTNCVEGGGVKGAAGTTGEVETGEQSSGDTSSKKERVGARSRRSSASH